MWRRHALGESRPLFQRCCRTDAAHPSRSGPQQAQPEAVGRPEATRSRRPESRRRGDGEPERGVTATLALVLSVSGSAKGAMRSPVIKRTLYRT
jgi:hypothetical protein